MNKDIIIKSAYKGGAIEGASLDEDISLPDYQLFRCDHLGQPGGGVAMYIHRRPYREPSMDIRPAPLPQDGDGKGRKGKSDANRRPWASAASRKHGGKQSSH